MRLLFKFYSSYFNVAQELNDKDRLAFYDAIMKRQFMGLEPELKGMANFAYISQKHSIDSQVKGWEDKVKTTVNEAYNNAIAPPSAPPSVPPSVPPAIQVKEKEKEEEKVYIPPGGGLHDSTKEDKINWEKLIEHFNRVTGKKAKVVNAKTRKQLLERLKEGYAKEDIAKAITNCFNDPYHQDNPHFLTLEFISRADKFEKYATKIDASTKTKKPFREIGML